MKKSVSTVPVSKIVPLANASLAQLSAIFGEPGSTVTHSGMTSSGHRSHSIKTSMTPKGEISITGSDGNITLVAATDLESFIASITARANKANLGSVQLDGGTVL